MEVTHHATVVRSVSPSEYMPPETVDAEQLTIVVAKFGIDDARALIERAYQRPQATALQVLIVQTDFITLEAQNALLKVLEEPPQSTRFIFVVPPDFSLLPTLASRFAREEIVSESRLEQPVFADFMKLSYKDRLTQIDTALKKKDVAWQRKIKQGLIDYIAHHAEASLVELEFVARSLLTRGASNKMLLEHAALTLPTSSYGG